MARGRKPAITGLARPEGIIDDVIAPVSKELAREFRRNTRRMVRAQKKLQTAKNPRNKAAGSKEYDKMKKRNMQITRMVDGESRNATRNPVYYTALQQERSAMQARQAKRAAKRTK